MIYFTNTDLSAPHLTFIGRWDPFHKGHESLINKKRKDHPSSPVMIQVRITNTDTYSPKIRAEFIKVWMIEKKISGTIVIVPNVKGVYWGRTVGYEVAQIDVDAEIKEISATRIREKIRNLNVEWKKHIASKNTIPLLNPTVSKIMESGLVIWLTGCPSSGKTTIANLLNKKIKQHFPLLKIQLLDGDIVRSNPIARKAGFSTKERADHISRMGYLAKLFADHGIAVIASFISPDKKIREINKHMIGKNRYIEIYVKASKKERIKRDVKGLYKKAIEGKIENLTGFNAPYDEPVNPDVVCNTNEENSDESVKKIFAHIFENEQIKD